MYDQSLSTGQLLELLAAMPRWLADRVNGLTPAQLMTAPGPQQWSARDVLAHLLSCEDMWGKYIRIILAEPHPTIKAMNPTTWIKHTDYLEQDFATLLSAFSTQRAALLERLSGLDDMAWQRTALVTGAGKPRERSVYTYAEWLANHEKSHVRQINNLVRFFLVKDI